MRSFGKAMMRWIPLWILGPCLLAFPARLVVLIALIGVRGLVWVVATWLGLGALEWLDEALLLVEDVATGVFTIGLGWVWAHTGARLLLAPDVPEDPTLDRRPVALRPTRAMKARVAALGTLPLGTALLAWWLHALLVDLLQVDSMLWPIPLVLTVLPALAVVALARRVQAPRLIQTPTTLLLHRPLGVDLRLALSEIQAMEVDEEGELRIETRGRRILAGRVDLPLPEGLPALLGQVEQRVEEAAGAEVDPELRALREQQRTSG